MPAGKFDGLLARTTALSPLKASVFCRDLNSQKIAPLERMVHFGHQAFFVTMCLTKAVNCFSPRPSSQAALVRSCIS